MATTRVEERLLASLGKLLQGAPIRFESVSDVPNGGVLCALPALLMLGLSRHSQKSFSLPAGYYPWETIFLVIALVALARIRSLEALRYQPLGEWGQLLGLDRIPEVRALREKIELLCQDGKQVHQWSSTLAKEWMEAQPESAGTLYIDGQVRVYHGSLTQWPRRYVARQRLCLRGTTDYWVNAMDGQPSFVVTQAADPGLIKVLEEQIVPRLLADAPGQPTAEHLAANPWQARLTLIFDRAGYSPEFFARMWALRVAVITYHKFPQGQWSDEEFTLRKVRLINGEEVEMLLAERGVALSNGRWMREIGQKDEKGHQTAMIATDYQHHRGFIEALKWLEQHFPNASSPPCLEPFSPPHLRLPVPKARNLWRVQGYLRVERGIRATLIAPLIDSALLYADPKANAVFLLLGDKTIPSAPNCGAPPAALGAAWHRVHKTGSEPRDRDYQSSNSGPRPRLPWLDLS